MTRLPMGLRPLELGGGHVVAGDRVRLELPAGRQSYADAQVDDTAGRDRSQLRWRPPLILELQARVSPATPTGTLGFGFWNDPFALGLGAEGGSRRLPAPPQALWFFYGSAPNDLSLAGMAGPGWRAASLRSPAWPSFVFLPAAAAAWLVSWLPVVRQPLLALGARGLATAEAPLTSGLDSWHSYRLQWRTDRADFWVDQTHVLTAPTPPAGPLGFVAWIDNQYAVVTGRGPIRFGVMETGAPQSLELEGLSIRQL